MHIEIHIFPNHFSIAPEIWAAEMRNLQHRITHTILAATVNAKSGAMGKTTLLANDDSGMVVATIDIRRE